MTSERARKHLMCVHLIVDIMSISRSYHLSDIMYVMMHSLLHATHGCCNGAAGGLPDRGLGLESTRDSGPIKEGFPPDKTPFRAYLSIVKQGLAIHTKRPKRWAHYLSTTAKKAWNSQGSRIVHAALCTCMVSTPVISHLISRLLDNCFFSRTI